MGTRADFYICRDKSDSNKKLRWLGSMAFDGDPQSIPSLIIKSTDGKKFIQRVNRFLGSIEDGSTREAGWPWPWDDSGLTDYTYIFYEYEVFVNQFDPNQTGSDKILWIGCRSYDVEKMDFFKYPNMSKKRNYATPGSARSGLMLIG